MRQGESMEPAVQGPGNRRIVSMLLEVLTARERLGDRERVARLAGFESGGSAQTTVWLGDDVLSAIFSSVRLDDSAARSLGHRLVTPDALGMPLYRFGLATPEKAYRRAQLLLPRDAVGGKWEAQEIDARVANLVYRPFAKSKAKSKTKAEGAKSADSGETRSAAYWAATCAIRRGMLEAIPMLYGLLPAEVEDQSCCARGDAECRYRVRWQRGSFRGLGIGLGLGGLLSGLAIGAAFTFGLPGSWGLGPAILFGGLATFASGAIGRSVDLGRQLEAVAGARRGQLALFDQVDEQLAEKLDALARVDTKLDAEGAPVNPAQVRLASDGEGRDRSGNEREIVAMADAIHSAAGDLECWFEAQALRESKSKKKKKRDRRGPARISDERAQLREIRDWSGRISEAAAPGARVRRAIDLNRLIARATVSVRPTLPRGARVQLDLPEDSIEIEGEAVALEQVVIQLIRNAIDASESLTDQPEVRISLATAAGGGAELCVEDRGTGIDSAEVDEVFDPFFTDGLRGPTGGLPECLEIVEAHGGSLRIEAEERPGTRVSILFPKAAQTS